MQKSQILLIMLVVSCCDLPVVIQLAGHCNCISCNSLRCYRVLIVREMHLQRCALCGAVWGCAHCSDHDSVFSFYQ